MDSRPLILLGALLLGGVLIVNGMKEEKEDEDLEDDIPSSIDYDDENLKRAMNPIDEEDEEEDEL